MTWYVKSGAAQWLDEWTHGIISTLIRNDMASLSSLLHLLSLFKLSCCLIIHPIFQEQAVIPLTHSA